jgi:Ser/Thr protein kinase RdoA (MazF antagonist)
MSGSSAHHGRVPPVTRRVELARLRRVGRSALAAVGLVAESVTLLQYEQNATFKVRARGGLYVLRISRAGLQTAATVESEAAWLAALARDTSIVAPVPVASPDGRFVVEVDDPELNGTRLCVVFEWLEGRRASGRPTPGHLAELGGLIAGLQRHALGWKPPPGFVRPRIDRLTSAGQRASIGPSASVPASVLIPAVEDAEAALELVTRLMSADAGAQFRDALELAWSTTRTLRDRSEPMGLIHADLHLDNVLFQDGQIRVIDFDDCGWGYPLYDVAVELTEITQRPDYDRLSDALLGSYASVRPLPPGYEAQLAAFKAYRLMQVLIWILESRDHPAFRDRWRAWAADELGWLRRLTDAARP